MSCQVYLVLKMSDNSGELVDSVVGVAFLVVGRHGSDKSRVSYESSCLGNLNRQSRMYSGKVSPADPDMSDRGS